MGVIYKATNLTNNKIYIGQTMMKLSRRISNHFSKCGKDGIYFHNALDKYGKDNFIWEIIEECNDREKLNNREIYYIEQYEATDREIGYNTSLGKYQSPFAGWDEKRLKEFKKKISIISSNRSEETKTKMSNSQKGREVNQYTRDQVSKAHKGIPRTQEVKDKISKSNMSKKQSKETINKRLQTLKNNGGLKHTAEAKRKIADASRNRIYSDETRKKQSESKLGGLNSMAKKVYCETSDEFFNTIKEASCAKYPNYHWQYANRLINKSIENNTPLLGLSWCLHI